MSRVTIMRWMALNVVGCVLWLSGLAYARGIGLIGLAAYAGDGRQAAAGLGVGAVGLFLLMWVNVLDAP